MPIQQATRSTPRADLGVAYHEFQPGGYIAEKVMPPMDVQKEAATIGVITRENYRTVDAKHANGGAFGRIHLTSEDKSYQCEDYGIEGQLTDRDREFYATDYNAEVEITELVKTQMAIQKEIRVAAQLFNTTTWTGSDLTTDVSGDWDAASSDIVGHIRSAKKKVFTNTGQVADSMIIGKTQYDNLFANTAILGKFTGVVVPTDDVIAAALARILGLRNIFVGEATYNSAAEGQTAVMTEIWSDDYALIFKHHSGSLATAGLGRTLRWVGTDGVLQNGMESVVQYREEQTESDIFRVRDYVDELVFEAYMGHLLQIDA
jgi:hypothetical protein